MMDQLEMLTAREQLMEDIISIVESQLPGQNVGQLEQLLCDAVCKNFAVVMPSTDRGQDSAFMDDNFGGQLTQTGQPPDQLARWHTKWAQAPKPCIVDT